MKTPNHSSASTSTEDEGSNPQRTTVSQRSSQSKDIADTSTSSEESDTRYSLAQKMVHSKSAESQTTSDTSEDSDSSPMPKPTLARNASEATDTHQHPPHPRPHTLAFYGISEFTTESSLGKWKSEAYKTYNVIRMGQNRTKLASLKMATLNKY